MSRDLRHPTPLNLKSAKESKLFPGEYINRCIECGCSHWSEKLNFVCDDCRNKPITQDEVWGMFGTAMPIEASSLMMRWDQSKSAYHLRVELAKIAKAWKAERAEKYGTRIVAAAIRFHSVIGPNGDAMPPVIVMCEAPGRHVHAMHGALGLGVPSTIGAEQGFVTDKGAFVDRDIAGWIASEAKQTLDGEPKSHLFSEDLW